VPSCGRLSGLPILGVIRLDKDDLDAMAGSGILAM
jgi:hypothetical protein